MVDLGRLSCSVRDRNNAVIRVSPCSLKVNPYRPCRHHQPRRNDSCESTDERVLHVFSVFVVVYFIVANFCISISMGLAFSVLEEPQFVCGVGGGMFQRMAREGTLNRSTDRV